MQQRSPASQIKEGSLLRVHHGAQSFWLQSHSHWIRALRRSIVARHTHAGMVVAAGPGNAASHPERHSTTAPHDRAKAFGAILMPIITALFLGARKPLALVAGLGSRLSGGLPFENLGDAMIRHEIGSDRRPDRAGMSASPVLHGRV